MHHSAIRIHLTRLEEAGLIVSRTLRHQGVVGRPQLVYLPNPAVTTFTLPPRNYELLARVALEYAAAGASGVFSPEDFGTTWGQAYLRDSRGAYPLPLAEALPALVTELRALGGSPELLDLDGDGYALIEHNCLFGDVSTSHQPLVCLLHQGLARGMLQELAGESFQWTSRSTLAGGADHCHIDIQPASPSAAPAHPDGEASF
jgi:predicted ArsR family transcriptional regulator